MTKVKATGKCVFCDSYGELTEEDAWPRWLRRIFGSKQNAVHEEIGSQGQTVRIRKNRSLIDVKVPVVCAECNNVWMSQLESEAQPVLKPLILGQQTRLDRDAQETIARWFTKTGMMLDLATQEPVIPSDHYRTFHDFIHPLDHTCVILSWTEVASVSPSLSYLRFDNQLQLTHENGQKLGDPHFYYIQTFKVGHLVAQLFWTDSRDFTPYFFKLKESRGHLRAWPHPDDATWPTSRIDGFELFRAFGNRHLA